MAGICYGRLAVFAVSGPPFSCVASCTCLLLPYAQLLPRHGSWLLLQSPIAGLIWRALPPSCTKCHCLQVVAASATSMEPYFVPGEQTPRHCSNRRMWRGRTMKSSSSTNARFQLPQGLTRMATTILATPTQLSSDAPHSLCPDAYCRVGCSQPHMQGGVNASSAPQIHAHSAQSGCFFAISGESGGGFTSLSSKLSKLLVSSGLRTRGFIGGG